MMIILAIHCFMIGIVLTASGAPTVGAPVKTRIGEVLMTCVGVLLTIWSNLYLFTYL